MNQNVMMKRFSDNLLMLMGKNDYTNKFVEHKLGISDSTLRNYMSGTSLPSVYVASQIADLFGVTIDELVGRK